MKKKRYAIIFVILCVVLCLLPALVKKPYRHLAETDVIAATVSLTPPDKTVPVTDISYLVDCLHELVFFYEDNSYSEYVGQAVTFTLEMSDGSQEIITAYNPFAIINGTGYRTKYGPCEKLNDYANRLLRGG